jgi:hypothetical protein
MFFLLMEFVLNVFLICFFNPIYLFNNNNKAHDITCDEAPMTGESELIKKNPIDSPFMLCGCKVLYMYIYIYIYSSL